MNNSDLISVIIFAMDKIVVGIFQSTFKPDIKRALLSKIVMAARSPQSTEVIDNVIKVCLEYSIKTDHQEHWNEALNVYKEWAVHNLSSFFALWSQPDIITYIFTQGERHRTLLMVSESLRLLSKKGDSSLSNVCVIIGDHVTGFLKANQDLETAVTLSDLLMEFVDCVPIGNDTIALCDVLLWIISRQHFQAKGAGVSIVNEMKEFEMYVEKLASVIGSIWRASSSENAQKNVLTLFSIIGSIDLDNAKPMFPIALGSIVKHLKVEYAADFAERIACNSAVTDSQFMSALMCLQAWLSWPTVENVDVWLQALLNSIASNDKVYICVQFAEDNIEMFLKKMELAHVVETCLNMMEYLLSVYRHSACLFHKVCPLIPDLLTAMTKLSSNHSVYTPLIPRVVKLCYAQIDAHPGYPDIYDVVLSTLKGYPQLPSTALPWSAPSHGWRMTPDVLYSPRKANASLVVQRDENIGLENLGNTCYINSCLQALYFIDRFRNEILGYDVTSMEPSFKELQRVFSFLKYSQRPYYCAESFSNRCRPSYFTLGTQQDAAEYLRYLLNHLHDEYMNTVKTGLNAVAGETSGHGSTVRSVVRKVSTLTSKLSLGMMAKSCEGTDCGSTPSRNPVCDVAVAQMKSMSDDLQDDTGDEKRELCSSVNMVVARSIQQGRKIACEKMDSNVKVAYTESESANEQHGMTDGVEGPVSVPLPLKDFEKLSVTKSIGGTLESCITCLSCSSVSCRTETFVDITLAFSESLTGKPCVNSSTGKRCHLLTDMLKEYFNAEKLEGVNQFHCGSCQALRDAERRVLIKQLPQTLVLTLMRFKYEPKTNSTSKISGDVKFPLVLMLPGPGVSQSPDGSSSTPVFVLTSVIIHSGISPHGGHYYVYTRHMTRRPIASMNSTSVEECEDLLEDKWFLANDETVTEKKCADFINITQKYHRDTPYMLFYTLLNEASEEVDVSCPVELLSAVQRDNDKYRQELQAMIRKSRAKTITRRRDDSSDDDPPSSCGGHFNNSLDSPRFIF